MSQYPVNSSQTQVHERLIETVNKHTQTIYHKPIPSQQRELFYQAECWVSRQNKPLLLDMGCGVGRSSVLLAKTYPDYIVIGIDKSKTRLNRNPYYRRPLLDNLLLLPANCIDFWRLLVQAQLPVLKQFILYPNPYPKTSDLTKRWHGHPVFPWLINVSSTIELRSNWRIYLQEFVVAAQQINSNIDWKWLSVKESQEPLTHFERKYWLAGELTMGLEIYLNDHSDQ